MPTISTGTAWCGGAVIPSSNQWLLGARDSPASTVSIFFLEMPLYQLKSKHATAAREYITSFIGVENGFGSIPSKKQR